MRAVLSQAVREEIIGRNVAKLVQVATPDTEEIRPWSDAEARAFLQASRRHRLDAFFVVALALGLRRGELLGLRWVDLDVRAGQLRVTQTLQRIRGAGAVYGPPKSRRSRRTLTMPAVVVRALAEHHQRQGEDRKAAAGDWVETGLVFMTGTGRHVEPRNLSTAFGRLLARSGVRPIRFHDSDTPARPCACLVVCHRGW